MTSLVLWLHIVAAGAWIGTDVVQAVAPRFIDGGGAPVRANWARAVAGFGTRIYTPAAIVLLLTGIELVRSGGHRFSDAFVLIGIAVVVIGGVLGGTVFGPDNRRLAASLEAGETEAVQRLTKKLRSFGLLDTVLILFATYAMVANLGS